MTKKLTTKQLFQLAAENDFEIEFSCPATHTYKLNYDILNEPESQQDLSDITNWDVTNDVEHLNHKTLYNLTGYYNGHLVSDKSLNEQQLLDKLQAIFA